MSSPKLVETPNGERELNQYVRDAFTMALVKQYDLALAKSEYRPTGYSVWFVVYRRDGKYIVAENHDLNAAVDECVGKI